MDKVIDIGGKKIGKGKPVFIIAEAGVNHNGKLRIAKQLVHAAKWAGADAIKFQTFKAEDLVSENVDMANYQKKNTGISGKQIEMLKKLELNNHDFIDLKKYCDRKGILFLSTPHTRDAIDFLEPLIPLYKIGSGDLTNIPFLLKIAKIGKPMIISTGMATIEEIRESLDQINKYNKNTILLHCTTSYPCPITEVNLRAMQTLEKEFGCLVGYSDHTLGINVMVTAARFGAVIIEKHLTLDKDMEGPDHKASIDPIELKEAIHKIRDPTHNVIYSGEVLGSAEKRPTKSELAISPFIRKSILSSRNINKGEKFSNKNLIIKRPGTGLQPKYYNELLKKIAKVNIKEGTPIITSMVGGKQ